jgi:hypothetical protein
MDYSDYCREISSWINPLLLHDANMRFIKNRGESLDRRQTCLASWVIESPEEACFRELIERYLKGFYIPKGIIDLANLDNSFSSKVKQWLSSLTFKGRIYDAPKDIHLSNNLKPLLIVEEGNLFLDIIEQPLQMLGYMISKCAETWKPMRQINGLKPNLYLKHSSPGPTMVYIESKVAVSYGFDSAADCGVECDSGTVIWGYRYTAVGGIKSLKDEIFIKAAQEAADAQAKSTHSD